MKKKFYRSCVSMLLTMVMIFGGVHIGAGAVVVRPPIFSGAEIDIIAPRNVFVPGETFQLSVVTDPIGLGVSWSSNDTSVVTINSYGVLTAISPGTATITATNCEVNGVCSSGSVNITVLNATAGMMNNTEYYIMNQYSGYLLSLEEVSDDNLTNAFMQVRGDVDISRWKLEIQSNGTFQFINGHSSTNKCLTVNGDNLCINSDTSALTQKFTIERVTTEPYDGLYFIKYGTLYLAQGTNDSVVLTSTEDDKCYWSFMAVGTRFADIFGFDHYSNDNTRTSNSEMINSTKHFDYFKEVMSDIGYIANKHITDVSTIFTYGFLQSDDIFVYVGHADFGMIIFRPDPTAITPEGRIIAHSNIPCSDPNTFYIDEMPDNALARERCILYLGCNSGSDFLFEGTNYNLVDETFDKGAHFVLGFTQVVVNGDVDDFLEGFLAAVHTSYYNIEECIDIAQRTVILDPTNNGQYLSYYSRGDKGQYLSLS